MKIKLLLYALFLGSSLPIFAQTSMVSSDELSKRIVTSVANVKPGELVIVEGGKEQIELMEAIGEQIHKKGAFPRLMLKSERVEKAYLSAIPEEHFSAHHQAEHKLDKHIDLAIILANNIDYPALGKQVPKEYADKHNKLMEEEHNSKKVNAAPPFKIVFVDLPSKTIAKEDGIDFAIYEKMVNDAIAADYTAIAARGKQLATLLKNGKKVQVTTSSGTNFSFELAGRAGTINDGVISDEDIKSPIQADKYVSLPAGQVAVSGLETSANGKVFIPIDKQFGSQGPVKITKASFDFVNGKIENYKAESNQIYIEKKLKDGDPMMNLFGGIVIGLNPALKLISSDTQHYRPMQAEGYVTLIIGNNEVIGGTNKTFDGFVLPIEKATVSIDGQPVIKDGKLMAEKLSSSK